MSANDDYLEQVEEANLQTQINKSNYELEQDLIEMKAIASSIHQPIVTDSPVKQRLERDGIHRHTPEELRQRELLAEQKHAAEVAKIKDLNHSHLEHVKEVNFINAAVQSFEEEEQRLRTDEMMTAAERRRNEQLLQKLQRAHEEVEHARDVCQLVHHDQDANTERLAQESNNKLQQAELRRNKILEEVSMRASLECQHAQSVAIQHQLAEEFHSQSIRDETDTKLQEAAHRHQAHLSAIAEKAHNDVEHSSDISSLNHMANSIAAEFDQL